MSFNESHIKKNKIKNIFYLFTLIILTLLTIGGCVFGLLSQNAKAILPENITAEKRIGGGADLFSDRTTINSSVFIDLCKKMSNGTDYLKPNKYAYLKNKGYILKMANIDWQVVFRSGDFVTLLKADICPSSNNFFGVSYWSDNYNVPLDYANFSVNAPIRETLNDAIYPDIFSKYYTLSDNIIATPRDLFDANIYWQSGQRTIGWGVSRRAINSGLGSSDNTSTAAYDKLWIPSAWELFSDSGGYNGLWGLSQAEIAVPTVIPTTQVWTRSFADNNDRDALSCLYDLNGKSTTLWSTNSYFVRPALHLNLAKIAAISEYALDFSGNNVTISPSTSYKIKPNSSLNVTFQNNAQGYALQSITDQFGFNLPLNKSGGVTDNYNYTTSFNSATKVLTLTLSNVTNHIEFTVHTSKTLEIINSNTANIINVVGSRDLLSSPTATITAEFHNNYIPRISFTDCVIEMSEQRGSGTADLIDYNFVFVNSGMTLNLNGLPNGIFTITLDIRNTSTYTLTINVSNANTSILYDNDNNAKVVIKPQTNFWVNSMVLNSITYFVEYKEFIIYDPTYNSKIIYYADSTNNRFEMYFKNLTQNSVITLNVSNAPPQNLKDIGGVNINGVAIKTTVGGDAKVMANDLENNEMGSVTLVAWVNAGYAFVGWSVDGGSTYLIDSSGNKYGASAIIPAEQVKGCVVTACFEPIANGNINTEIGDGNFL